MSSSSGSVEDKIRMLPPDLREEAIHYIDELLKRSKRTSPASFRCAAEGTLAEPEPVIPLLTFSIRPWNGGEPDVSPRYQYFS